MEIYTARFHAIIPGGYTYVYMRISMYICIYLGVRVYICIYMYIYVYICMYIYIFTHICMFVCICIYIHMYTYINAKSTFPPFGLGVTLAARDSGGDTPGRRRNYTPRALATEQHGKHRKQSRKSREYTGGGPSTLRRRGCRIRHAAGFRKQQAGERHSIYTYSIYICLCL